MSNYITDDCASGLHDYCTPCQCECHKEYHTMDELYEHRHELFIALVKHLDNYITPLGCRHRCWKSKLHNDGMMFDDSFILGISSSEFNGPESQITYHLPLKYWDRINVMEFERAPEWDGHTSNDVLERLRKL